MIRVGEISIPWGQNMFPDHSLLLKLNSNEMFDHRGAVKVEWFYEGDSELFTLVCVKRHIDTYFLGERVILYMPYIPHARMDRVKTDEDVFTLKYFAEVINSLHFSIVWVRDAHSNVSLALLNNVIQESINSYIHRAILDSGAEALFFPDEGAMKRYSEHATIPFAFGMKNRDWATGQIIGLDIINIDNIVGKNVLIVDDICSRGGTFYHSAKALKEANAANINLYITHCENTILEGEIFTSGLINKVYTTDSLVHCEELKEKIIYV